MGSLRSIFCPFCGIETFSDYEIMLHLETLHPEGETSPFVVQENYIISNSKVNDVDSKTDDTLYLKDVASNLELLQGTKDEIKCLEENQTELNTATATLTNEFLPTNVITPAKSYDDEQEEIVFKPRCLRSRRKNQKNIHSDSVKISETRSKPESSKTESSSQEVCRRLGKSDLGPHAHEDKMPGWLIKLLKEQDGVNKTIKRTQNGISKDIQICPNMMMGIIPLLVHLLSEDKSTLYAYTCHRCVRHVSRLKREDGFCGYRNIQMMTSYIVSTESQGCEILGNKIPSIFDIQDYIEMAWDLGFNSHGRIETNGIRGTRKYIGTSEAQAMFCGLGIPCEVQGITKCKITDIPAYELLLTAVEDYFSCNFADMESKVRCTYLPPIYFQHQGHSMTIVGFEKRSDGSRNLIVFDPRYFNSSKSMELFDRASINVRSDAFLSAYRKGTSYLKRFKEFEILKLLCPSSNSIATERT